jgi:hypothetical protein
MRRQLLARSGLGWGAALRISSHAMDATCAAHPDREARGVCRRCGDVVCAECDRGSGPEPLCERCLAVAVERVAPAARAYRRLAWTYYLAGGGLSLCCVPVAAYGAVERSETPAAWWATVALLALAGGAALIATGWGIGRFDRRALAPALILAALMLLSVPLGTIAGAEALYTLLRHESVLKQEADALRAIPQAGADRIPLWQIIVIAMLVVGIVAFVAFAANGGG